MSGLYILEINPMSVASFANIFSHSEGFSGLVFYHFDTFEEYWSGILENSSQFGFA